MNRGDFWFRFDHVDEEEGRVWGQMDDDRHVGASEETRKLPDTAFGRELLELEQKFGQQTIWDEVADYLYEFGAYVCRGSGAEPVHGSEPKECFLKCL